jgi:hypothetical protein
MTMLVILFLVFGVLEAAIGLPSSLALFLVGAERVHDGAVYYACTGCCMLIVSIVGPLWIFLK